jgi:hypothetical protein
MNPERLQELQLSRYEANWERRSAYLPLAPTSGAPSRTWSSRLSRILWRAWHSR